MSREVLVEEPDAAPRSVEGACVPEKASGARFLLALALLLGLVRFWKLGEWSLWFDEAATWTDWFVGIHGGEIQNPLGYELVHATVQLLGGRADELALRFLPALAGWLAIPATAWAFRPIAGARGAALAALLVAASSWEVYWSQNARFYTLAQLATLVGAGLALRGLASASPLNAGPGRASLPCALGGLALTACGALFHASAALLVPPLLLALLWAPFRAGTARRPARRTVWFLAAGAAAVALVAFPWGRETLRTYLLQKGDSSPFDDLGQLASRVAHLAKTCGFFFTPYLGAAAVVGALLAWKRRELGGTVAAIVACGVLVLAALMAAAGARMTAQYVFFLFPWIALLAVLPASQLAHSAAPAAIQGAPAAARTLARAWAFVLVACSLVTTALYFTVRQGERPPWRDAYQFVWNRREPDDLVLGMEATVGEYYVAPWRTELRQPEHIQWLDKWRATLPDLWSRHARRMWLIVNPEQFLDWAPADAAEVQRFLREECRLVKVWPLYVESRDLSVWVYVRD